MIMVSCGCADKRKENILQIQGGGRHSLRGEAYLRQEGIELAPALLRRRCDQRARTLHARGFPPRLLAQQDQYVLRMVYLDHKVSLAPSQFFNQFVGDDPASIEDDHAGTN